jgi:hypothetical protein
MQTQTGANLEAAAATLRQQGISSPTMDELREFVHSVQVLQKIHSLSVEEAEGEAVQLIKDKRALFQW